ncbi:MAG: serine/threonine protein kinase, partial [Deltaproteobacteria bacterium]|nr:serine/threonine protein kinase [Deltaproteobacteria bacterium]
MAVDDCPSENTLLDVVVEQRVGELAPHLDACDACRELVASLVRTEPRPQPLVGRFEIERVLGAGAMGIVYLAWDPRLDRRVPLKVMHPEAPVHAVDEGRAMARIAHENLVTIYEVEIVDEHVAIAMEYQPGGTLRDWMQARHAWREVVRAMRDVARGLAAIHDAGLVHRDLKPDNVLFDANGRARISDFGLAMRDGDAPRRAGTPAYMAPEQLAGVASARSDQWSFFVCLYEALAGQRRRPNTEPVPIANAPRALRAMIARGLQREP